MPKIEYHTIDKSSWGPGPWTDEPDKVQWTDEETGLLCLIKRVDRSGHLCGYVGVGPDHPLYGKETVDLSAHGGITFVDFHIPEPGIPDDIWWFGFDCAHAGDSRPARKGFSFGDRGTYKTIAYVEANVHDLAKQLAAFKESV